MADSDTAFRYGGSLLYNYKPGLPSRRSSPGPTGGVPNKTGWGNRWHCCPHWNTPCVQRREHYASKSRVISSSLGVGPLEKQSPLCSQGRSLGQELMVRLPRKKTPAEDEGIGPLAQIKARYHTITFPWWSTPENHDVALSLRRPDGEAESQALCLKGAHFKLPVVRQRRSADQCDRKLINWLINWLL